MERTWRKFVSALHPCPMVVRPERSLRSAKLKKLDGTPAAAAGGHMVVNCEWGAFDNSVRRYSPSGKTMH